MGIKLSDIEMSVEKKKGFIGFHAFTGYDCISSFFRKSRAACWKILEENEKFISTFIALGSDWSVAKSVLEDFEEFVCCLYGRRSEDS